MTGEYEPTRWWRVLDKEGKLWCETSDEQEARDSLFFDDYEESSDVYTVSDRRRPGYKLQKLYTKTLNEWRDE